MSDLYAVLQWWFILFVLGIGFLPLTTLIFEKFFDRGYIFSKLFGLVFTTYAVFIVGILHLAPFTMLESYAVFLMLSLLTFFLLPTKKKILSLLKKSWKIFLLEEALFLVALSSWAYIHAFAPEIHGLEKYMDYGFINSILRGEYFPPKDMWFSPLLINYYYFGHLMTAVLTKLSALPAQITFNLMLSTIFAFCLVETFSLGANLYTFLRHNAVVNRLNQIIAGLLTALLVTFAGNLHILYAFFKPYSTDNPEPLWKLAFLPETFPNSYWYPNATRYIYHTIHEFPIYSWVVADLHGHVLDIPFVLLMIALLLAVFMKYTGDKTNEEHTPQKKTHSSFLFTLFRSFYINPLFLILIGFLLAIMFMTNAWDGAIYLLFAALVVGYIQWHALENGKHSAEKKNEQVLGLRKGFFLSWGINVFLAVMLILSTFYLFTLPYNLFFKPFVSGIGVLCSPEFLIKIGKIGPLLFEADHCQHSYWWELLTLYGFFLIFTIIFMVFLFRVKQLLRTDIFVMLLIILGMILIVIPEFIYVKDIYPAHYRANTMFKLVFQAFIMLSISCGYIIVRIVSSNKGTLITAQKRILHIFFLLLTTSLLTAVLTYPYLAVTAYYGNLKIYKGLDGTAYLKNLYPTDYQAINWLNNTVSGQPVILEAQGDSYTDYARVSANTGLPTILGWTVHEWLWRGSYDIPAPRIDEIKKIYETTDASVAQSLLSKHKVSYIFIGELERQKYPTLSEEKFPKLGTLVYQNGNTKIYRVTPTR